MALGKLAGHSRYLSPLVITCGDSRRVWQHQSQGGETSNRYYFPPSLGSPAISGYEALPGGDNSIEVGHQLE